jgi:hypothetical protein
MEVLELMQESKLLFVKISHSHIGLVIIPRPRLALECVSGQYGDLGMITSPIGKCPCINL